MRNVDQQQIPSQLSEASQRRRAKLAQRRHGRFVKGPIPLPWLQQAAKLPGKTLAVAMAIWYMKGLTRSGRNIVVGDALVADFGVSRKARYHALERLEKAGLVSVDQQPGKCPRVTVLKSDKGP